MTPYIAEFKTWLHGTILGHYPFLENGALRVIDVLTWQTPRFQWIELVEAVLLSLVVYLGGRQVRPEGGWRGFLRYLFPKRLYAHPSAMVDYQLNIVNVAFGYIFNLTWRINTVFMTGLISSGLIHLFGPPAHPLPWTGPLVVAVTLLALISEDFGGYVLHYVSHKVPFLWALHKVHHSAEVITPFTANRVHPMEAGIIASTRAVFISLVIGPTVYLFGGPPATPTIFGMAATVVIGGALGSVLMHSHIWLSWGRRLNHIIFCPAMHQIHHSQMPRHWDRNFAPVFAIWDWMFGTIYIPDGHEEIVYGIYGEPKQIHPNLLAAWLRPFWDMIPMRDRIVDLTARVLGPWVRDLALRLNLVRLPAVGSKPGIETG